MLKHYVFGNVLGNNCTNKNMCNEFTQRLKDCYVQKWRDKINNSEKLHQLAVLCENNINNCKFKYYLVNIKNSPHRKIVIKLRTASTYMKFGILSNDKNTGNKVCEMYQSGDQENLEHILLHCNKHKIIRDDLIEYCNIKNDTNSIMLTYILNFEVRNSKFHGKILIYINKMCDRRGLK